MELSESGRRLSNLRGVTHHGLKRVTFKAMSGRRCKKAAWVVAFYSALRTEFDRLHALNVKLSPSFLACAVKYLIHNAESDTLFASSNLIDGKPVVSKITIRWVQTFMDVQGLVIRRQAGSLAVSPEKKLFIEKTVAFHLGKLKRSFESGDLNEGLVENADEMHFVFNMENGRIVGFRGDEKVKYSDVVSVDEGITMMVRISGGVQERINPPMLVFQNPKSSYPIRGVEYNVPGVCYRSGRKGWMENRVFQAWMPEPRDIRKDNFGRKRVLYVENCSGHNETNAVLRLLREINTDLCKFPENATDMVQPADSFVISKIKDAWRKRWDEYKVGLMSRGEWMRSKEGASGKLRNPGKRFS